MYICVIVSTDDVNDFIFFVNGQQKVYTTIVHHTDNAKGRKICHCSIENRCLYIECKERSIVCTMPLIFVLPTLTPSRNLMKMLMNGYAL